MSKLTINLSDGKEVSKFIGGLYLNCFPYSHEDFFKMMSVQKSAVKHNFTMLCIEWFKTLASVTYFDARNEDSVMLARKLQHLDSLPHKQISKAYIANEILADYRNENDVLDVIIGYVIICAEDYNSFYQQMLYEHKTLQQNFSRFCMKWFEYIRKENSKSRSVYILLANEALKHQTNLKYI